MCGRFVLTTPAQALAEHLAAMPGELSLRPQYNIAPTQDVDGERLKTCCLLTANATLTGVHDRMPVLLAPQDYALWLDPAVTTAQAVQPLLAPADDDKLAMHAVDTCVGDVRNDDERNIARADTGELPLR